MSNAIKMTIDELIEHAYNYNTENTDCPYADFVSSFGYGDADMSEIRRDFNQFAENNLDLSDDDRTKIESMTMNQIADCCELDCRHLGHPDSIYSAVVGEIEIDLSDYTEAEIEEASRCNCIINGHAYTSSCDCWCMVPDLFKIGSFLNDK